MERGIGNILFNIWLLIFENYPQQPEDGFIIEQQSRSSLYSCSHSVKTSAEFSWHNLVFLFDDCSIDHDALSLKFLSKLRATCVRDSMDNINIVRVVYNQKDYKKDK